MEWRTDGDTAYRSKANEEFMEKNGFVSHVHRKKPKGRSMPKALSRANNAKSKVRTGEPRLQYQTIAVPKTHCHGIAPPPPPLSVQNALARQKTTVEAIKQSNTANRGR